MSKDQTAARRSLTDTSNTAQIDAVFERVERAKQEWEATVDALPELVCLIDQEGRVLRANRTIEAWEIGDVRAIQGFGLHTLLHPGCLGLYCALDRYLRQAVSAAVAGPAAPHEAYDTFLQRYLRVRVQPVATRHQTPPEAAVVVMEDITDRRRSEEALQHSLTRLSVMNEIQRSILTARTPEDIAEATLLRLRGLISFRQARVVLRSADAQGFIMLTADANGLTHLRPSQARAAADFQLDDPGRWRQVRCSDDLWTLDQPTRFELQLLEEGQRSLLNVPLLVEGHLLGALLITSERVAAFNADQVEVAREVADLLAIVVWQAQLHRQLELSYAQLHHALRVKSEVVANVSHELRTPLGVIYGYTVLMEEGNLGPVATEQQQALGVMLKQEERLRVMVDRLVDLRASDALQVCRQPLNVAEWLTVVGRPWHKLAEAAARPLQIEMDLPVSQTVLSADGELLKQVVDNLLDNAFKFSPAGAAVRVVAKIDRTTVLIAVQDFGIGLAPDQIDQVFERFYQVDGSGTRRFGGMGIGLALCKDIVEAHGGRIWAESAGQGQGSIFWFALPLPAPQVNNAPE